jgi:ribonuclease HI
MASKPKPKVSRKPVLIVYTDGACSGNPGPGGWGVYIKDGTTEKELYGSDPQTTNNRMELLAVIKAFETITVPSMVFVHSDSSYVLKGIGSWVKGWKKNDWKLRDGSPVKNKDLWIQLDTAVAKHQCRWIWVKGHAGNKDNERVDALARKGAEEAAETLSKSPVTSEKKILSHSTVVVRRHKSIYTKPTGVKSAIANYLRSVAKEETPKPLIEIINSALRKQ